MAPLVITDPTGIKLFVNDSELAKVIIMEFLDRSSASTRAPTSSFTSADAFSDLIPERPVSAPMRMPTSGIYNVKGVGDVLAGRVEQGVVKPTDEVVSQAALDSTPERPVSAPMRMPISGIYNVKGVGDVLAGRVNMGVVKPNDEVVLQAASSPSASGKVSARPSNKKRKSSWPSCNSDAHLHLYGKQGKPSTRKFSGSTVPVLPPSPEVINITPLPSSRSMSSRSSDGAHKCPDCSKQLSFRCEQCNLSFDYCDESDDSE